MRFLVVPHANYRGMYDLGTDAQGRRVECAGGFGSQGCVIWPAQYYGMYGSGGKEESTWIGSLVRGQRDASGLMYRRNRYYDPETGRFTQQDPIGLAGGLNLYGYAGGDPVTYSDPFGLWPEGDPPGILQLIRNLPNSLKIGIQVFGELIPKPEGTPPEPPLPSAEVHSSDLRRVPSSSGGTGPKPPTTITGSDGKLIRITGPGGRSLFGLTILGVGAQLLLNPSELLAPPASRVIPMLQEPDLQALAPMQPRFRRQD